MSRTNVETVDAKQEIRANVVSHGLIVEKKAKAALVAARQKEGIKEERKEEEGKRKKERLERTLE